MSSEDVGKIPQRIFTQLLENAGGAVSYEQTGKVVDKKMEEKRDKENLEWVRSMKKGN